MSDLVVELVAPASFVIGLFVLIMFLAWLEQPHRWPRPRYLGRHLATRDRLRKLDPVVGRHDPERALANTGRKRVPDPLSPKPTTASPRL